MASTTVHDGDLDRLSWRWWDRFWLRCGLTLAIGTLLVEASRLSLGSHAPGLAVNSRPCVSEIR
jgi:hypothetical protein